MKVPLLRIVIFIVTAFLISLHSLAQVKNLGLPYMINYTSDDYHANKQNWSIVEDKRGIIYFGNTQGVLEFDGQNWKLISLPNKTIVRSLAIDKQGKIFVGSRGEFGYLMPDSIGTLNYISLLNRIEKEEDRKFTEDILQIFTCKGKIYFSGDNRLFEYSNGKVGVLKIPNLKQTFGVNDRIFVRTEGDNGGIGEYRNGKVEKISGIENSKDLGIRAILPYDNKLMFVTIENGLYVYDNLSIVKLETNINTFIEKEKIVSAIQLNDGNYAFGLFSSGLLITDKFGNVIQHLNINTGLQSGFVSNILQDSNDNLWLSTGNGITYILSSLPISNYGSLYGLNSTIYSVFLFENNLYLASNTGLLSRRWGSKEIHLNQIELFKEIGEPTNIWNLDTLKGTLFESTYTGISIINANKITNIPISDKTAVWKFLRIYGNDNVVIAGTNKGLILLEFKTSGTANKKQEKISTRTLTLSKNKAVAKKTEGKWIFKSKVRGFAERCRHILIDKKNQVWFADKAKGVARLVPVNNFDSVTVFWYTKNKGLPEDGEMYVFKINDEILVSSEHGMFSYDSGKDKFVESAVWNKLIGKGILITTLVEDKNGNFWFKQQRFDKSSNEFVFELGQLVPQTDGSFTVNKTPFYKLKNDIHSICPLPDGNLIVGATKGFVHYDPSIKKDFKQKYNALIRKVEFVANDSLIFDGAFIDSSGNVSMEQKIADIIKIPYRYNNLRFTFSSPYYDAPNQILFKFYLEGNDEGWSDWKTKNFKEYSNLKPGEFAFHVIAKNIYEVESEEAVYYFTVLPPWYRTIWAFIGYGILVILLIWGIVRLSVRRLRKQKEYLEKVVEERTAEIRMKNAELEQQKEEILAQRDEIEEKKEKIEEKNKNITASINYAKRIQEAMLPLRDKIDQVFEDYFILFKPRDIVSGDFYWFSTKNNKIIFTAVDCTGHGVPGAFMSMIGSEILTTIVNQGITVPAEILDYMNRYVRKALKQDQTENQDGMDMSLCTIDKQTRTVEWAGAKNPLVYVQNNEIFHLKGDMQSIGGHQLSKKERKFTNHIVSYETGPTYFYIFSDGYQDQFGGDKARKFMVKGLKDLIVENYQKPMKEQQLILDQAIEDWKKGVDQTDDILVIGFKLTP